MNIVTWNINGIRASKIPLKTLFDNLDADIICLQETKVTRDQLDEPSAVVDGYTSYFSFSKTKSGYSGVATFVRDWATPFRAEEGLTGLLSNTDDADTIGNYGDQSEFTDYELRALDQEGRTVLTQHKLRSTLSGSEHEELVTIINVYCPRADPENADRKSFKLHFYKLLQIRAEALLKKGHVIVLGDVNTSHERIDHCNPCEEKEFESNPGRQWLHLFLIDPEKMTKFLAEDTESTISEGKFVDTFRAFHPCQQAAYTCWSTVTGARATNYGVRIDYILANVTLFQMAFKDCVIMQEIEGSDHCPVKATIDWNPIASDMCPRLCTKWLPEFAGKQKKLSEFFTKKVETVSYQNVFVSTIERQTLPNIPKKPIQLPIKRACSGELKGTTKKVKLEMEKKPSGGKQGSLLSFFGKSSDGKSNQFNNKVPDDQCETRQTCSLQNEKNVGSLNKMTVKTEVSMDKKSTALSWKNLLKGPPAAPLCKGHTEPCLLRTVKKDTLNKGRQFWVCPRPEGHKSNPDARCEHFEWVKKK